MRPLHGSRKESLLECLDIACILEASGDEKKNLTVPDLIARFREIRNKDFTDDEGLLTEGN